MVQFYTYLHCKPNGDPFYVGKGKGNRAVDLAGRNAHHRNVVAKYSRENIDVFIFPRASEQDAFDTEIRWIAQFKREGHKLANKTDGGEGVSGAKWPVEALQRASVQRSNPSAATRAKIGSAHKGKQISSAQKEAVSMRHTGKVNSPETRLKMSLAQRGKNRSAETKKILSDAHKGKPWSEARRNAKKGKRHSEETKAKISLASIGKKKSPTAIANMCAAQQKRAREHFIQKDLK